MTPNLCTAIWQQAKKTPDATAIQSADEYITYQELMNRAKGLSRLLKEAGVQAGQRVAVALPRNTWLPTALLGIMDAGAAYLPIDPKTPPKRAAFYLSDASVTYLLTTPAMLSLFPKLPPCRFLLHNNGSLAIENDLGTRGWAPKGWQHEGVDGPVTLAPLAYVMYTSGSTGQPKGVQVTHPAISNVLTSYQKGMNVSADVRALSVSSASFDLSVLDFFLPLSVGGVLDVAPQHVRQDAEALANYLDEHSINWIQATPTTSRMLLEAGWSPKRPFQLLNGGDMLPHDLAEAIVATGCQLWNGYGITETTIQSTLGQYKQGAKEVAIGRPIEHTSITIRDPNRVILPAGEQGEITIGGVGLSLGYLGRPALDQEKFYLDRVDDPTSRVYRTGDLGQWTEKGELLCLGRLDRQIKIRGHRIEAGEIETQLRAHPLVQDVVVVSYTLQANDDKELLAYILPSEQAGYPLSATQQQALRSHLAELLPDYMLPSIFTTVKAFPLTLSGKIDRNALPAPSRDRLSPHPSKEAESASDTMTSSELETLICHWYSELLHIDQVSPTLNFTLAGGHSIHALRLVSLIRKNWPVSCGVADVFLAPTPRELATRLMSRRHDEGHTQEPIQRLSRPSEGTWHQPLSFAQERLWFTQQLHPENTEYNTSLEWTFCGQLEAEELLTGLQTLVAQHEILRTHFPVTDGTPSQSIAPKRNVDLPQVDLSTLPTQLKQEQAQQLARHWFQKPFALDRAPLFRCMLLKLASSEEGNEWRMLLSIHHILTDGWSHQTLFQEWVAWLRARQQDTTYKPTPLPIQYADYAHWQRQRLSEQGEALLAYWKEQLNSLPTLALPTTSRHPEERSVTGGVWSFDLPDTLLPPLRTLCHKHQTTPFTTLYTAFSLWLSRQTGQRDLPIGSLVANRLHHQLDGIIGYIANTLVLRDKWQPEVTFAQALSQAQKTVLGALEHQAMPFGKLVQSMQLPRHTDNQPLFQVCFVLQHPPSHKVEWGDLSFEQEEVHMGTSPFDLFVQMWESHTGFQGSFTYRKDLFDEETIADLCASFLDALGTFLRAPEQKACVWGPRFETYDAWLQEQQALQEWVILPRAWGRQVYPVAYVVTTSPQHPLPPSLEQAPFEVIRVHSLPFTSEGHIDEALLQQTPFVPRHIVQDAVEALTKRPEVQTVSASKVPWKPARGRVHKDDILPRQDKDPRTTSAPLVTSRAQKNAPNAVLSLHEGPPLVFPKDTPRSLRAVLERAAREVPDKGVTNIERDGEVDFLSYPALMEQATQIAHGLRQSGLTKGDPVILQCPRNSDYLPALWGCFFGGFVAMPLACPSTYNAKSAALDKVTGLWEALSHPPIIASGSSREGCEQLRQEGRSELVVLDLAVLRQATPDGDLPHCEWDEPTLLLLTSGSTGLPKPVTHHHRTIISFLEGYKQRHHFDDAEVFLNILGLDHVAPLFMCHLSGVYNLANGVNGPFSHFLQAPTQLLDWAEQYKATSTFLPNFAFGLVNQEAETIHKRSWALSSFHKITNGGEAVVAKTARTFLRLLAPHGLPQDAMIPIWGMSETSSATITSLSFRPESTKNTDTFVSIGGCIPGFSMRIVDAQDQLLPLGTEGRLQVRGASLMSGYYKRPDANASSLTKDGWFDTGDLAFINDDGMVITGRSKDVIIISGTNYYSHEIEAAVEVIPGVRRSFLAACAARPPGSETDEIAVFFAPEPHTKVDLKELIRTIRNALIRQINLAPYYVIPVAPEEIPKTEIGKIQRTKLNKRLAAGAFDQHIRKVDLLFENEQTLPDWAFQRAWSEKPLATQDTKGRALVFVADAALLPDWREALGSRGWEACFVVPGERLVQHEADHWTLPPKAPQQLEEWLSQRQRPDALLHAWSVPAKAETQAAIEQQQPQGIYSVLMLVQAAQRLWSPSNQTPLKLIVSLPQAPNAQESEPKGLIPWYHAPITGLLASIQHEWQGWSVTQVIAPPEQRHEAAASELVSQVPWQEVIYQDNKRLLAGLVQVRWSATPASEPEAFSAGDIVLVTGGLGGIGVSLCADLVSRGCRLLIVGRSALSPENARAYQAWQSIEGSCERAQRAGQPTDCHYIQVDFADTTTLLAQVEEREGAWGGVLKGVFHLASQLRACPLLEETQAGLEEVFASKLWGFLSIEALAATRPDLKLVDFGSVNGLFGGYQAAAYAAGSRAGDAFCQTWQKRGRSATHLTWTGWKNTGMTRGIPLESQIKSKGYLPIPPQEGEHMLWGSLRRPAAHWIIGLDATHPMIRAHLHTLPPTLEQWQLSYQLSPNTESTPTLHTDETLAPFLEELSIVQVDAPLPLTHLTGANKEKVSTDPLEAELRALWRELLSLKEVGLDQNFFELGGHSMLLGQLQERLYKTLGHKLPMIEFFRSPTIRRLAQVIREQQDPSEEKVPKRNTETSTPKVSIPAPLFQTAPVQTKPPQSSQEHKHGSHNEGEHPAMAIVGMACRFPGAPDVDTFWQQLLGGVESISTFTKEELREAGVPDVISDHPHFVPRRGIVEDADTFDASFFQMSPKQAELTDPQQRLLLETTWHCLEDAACAPSRFEGRIAMFAGCSANTYLYNNLLSNRLELASMGGSQALLSSDKDHLATLIAYKLDLRGPAVTVQTACSTSLVALHLACQSLRQGDCELALVGGVSIAAPFVGGHLYRKGHIFSPDGHCRAFDAEAEGTVSGDGVGVIAIKPLDAALAAGDPIRAVLRGVAINNDGSQKIGYAAPSIDAQADAIARAHKVAGVSAETIGYVEAHGTGTALGDPVEVAALTQAFRQTSSAKNSCALGSVKSNIGHLNTAAGIAGLIKAALSVQHGWLPPSLHFKSPNPALALSDSPFYVNATSRPWNPQGPRRAGVSSFGAGGTNAHVVLEQAPTRTVSQEPAVPQEPKQLHWLPLSAKTPNARAQQARQLGQHLQQHPALPLAEVAYTLQVGREHFKHRLVALGSQAMNVGESLSQGRESLTCVTGSAPEQARKLVFLLPPQGTQRVGMAEALYQYDPHFRSHLDHCFGLFQEHTDFDLKALLYPSEPALRDTHQERLNDQRYAGPALFSLSYSLGRTWMDRGVQPDALVGHSTGEFAAACLAEVLSLEDAMTLVIERSRLIHTTPSGGGVFLQMTPDEVRPLLQEGQYLALVNAPRSCVVTGVDDAMEAFEEGLKERSLPFRKVRISGPAHTPLFDTIAPALTQVATRCTLSAPKIPMTSGITGTWLDAQEALDPAYWSRHLTSPISFQEVMETVGQWDAPLLWEIGPYRSIQPLASLNLPDAPTMYSLPDPRSILLDSKDKATLWSQRQAARLWTEGVVSLPEPQTLRQKRALPLYPFQRQRYWVPARPGTLPVMCNLGEEEFQGQLSESSETPPQRTQRAPSTTATAPSSQRPKSRRYDRPALANDYIAPRDQVEAQLATMAAELLGLEDVGVEDEFLALGADSLITLRILTQLRERFGIELPQAAAFTGLTVAKMAGFFDDEMRQTLGDQATNKGSQEAQAPRVTTLSRQPEEPQRHKPEDFDALVVPLRQTGTRPPLFLLHPAAGVIFPYVELSKLLGDDQPVYAIQARGLDGKRSPDRTCEEMAERYIPLIRHVQPYGPYHIAGFSFGCYTGYEIARRLLEEGQETAFLGLIDEFVPIDGMRTKLTDLARLFIGRSGRSFLKHLRDYAALGRAENKRGKDWSLWKDWSRGEYWRDRIEHSMMAALLPPETHQLLLDQPAMRPMFELFLIHTWITFAYTPEPYEGRATLFKSDWTTKTWNDRRGLTGGLGWEKLVLGGLELEQCSGDHLGMIRPPHVQVLAEKIRQSMDRARKHHDSSNGPPTSPRFANGSSWKAS